MPAWDDRAGRNHEYDRPQSRATSARPTIIVCVAGLLMGGIHTHSVIVTFPLYIRRLKLYTN